MAANFQPLTFCSSYSISSQRSHFYTTASYFPSTDRHVALITISKTIPCHSILRAKRTGKRRYPSENKRLERMTKTIIQTEIKNKEEGFWRFSKLAVPVHKDPGKEFIGVSVPLLESIAKVIEFPVANMLPMEAFTVVRKSFDARKFLKDPQFVYTVDMDVKKLLNLEPHAWDYILRLKPKLGYTEYMPARDVPPDLISILQKLGNSQHCTKLDEERDGSIINSLSCSLVSSRPRVAVVGSGPSGLFTSLVLGELGANVTLIERGEAVEQRGRDIGALVVRRALQSESNFCFGEGGAGTWSDGKLVTRIGRNSDSVHAIMKTLVQFGAPPEILLDGKPHLGTDRLIRILRNFRQHLVRLGVDIKFGTRLDDLIVENKQIIGIKVSDSRVEDKSTQSLLFDAVVLAVGHSARDVYQMLLQHNVDIVPKDFAVGLRIEHPQELINKIQYSSFSPEVQFGRGKIPVADYKVVQYVTKGDENLNSCSEDSSRSCYSFCMCPGGQVVLTSTKFSEISINGMSFSRRSSRWANAAIVVTVSANDFTSFRDHGPLCGVEFQKHYERKAAMMGGGNFVVPAQAVTDFLDNKLSVTSLPQSSYRLGVKPSNLHELLPAHITNALQQSLVAFDRKLPGYISKDALLHGVETRTSSPVQILRDPESHESTSLRGLYPAGEGAGHAGGIVSAAVDGVHCGFALAKSLNLFDGDVKVVLGNAQRESTF